MTGHLDAFTWETPPELLGEADGPDLTAFEPDRREEEVPAFLGRTIAPSAAVSADPDLVPGEPAKEAPIAPVPPVVVEAKPEVAPAAPTPSAPPASPSVDVTPPRDIANGSVPKPSARAPEPEPVVFPVRHAPDDPGLSDDRRERFRLRV